MAARSFSGSVRAPEFPLVEWFNTLRPLSLTALRGKVVLLDFWTYGCINCMHVIPELKRLERKYPQELVVIGVHSAKFRNEGDGANIRQIILRYEVEHPVANDRDFVIWRTYGVRAWPTLVLVDPAGYIVGQKSGEGVYDLFDEVIAGVIAEFDSRGEIDRRPVELKLEREGLPQTDLSFPGKVLADEAGNRLFVTDSNHNRIVVADLVSHAVHQVVGGLDAGFIDGDFASARFSRPQGLALSADGKTLYVADTENHAVRAVDLESERVRTIAGTGRQSEVYPGRAGRATEVELNSPWDLELVGDLLYVAMAGSHQLWYLELGSGFIRPWAGTGGEGIDDGPAGQATLAQPSGLTSDGSHLFFADAEASAVRMVDLATSSEAPQVRTLVGTGLFDFGDSDGVGVGAQLQHCLGLAFHPEEGLLYVADTYNNKVKTLDPSTREVRTVAGGERGWRDGRRPLFYEPGGLAVAGASVFVADTNNHAVRLFHPASEETETVYFRDLRGLLAPKREFAGATVEGEPRRLSAGAGSLRLELVLPEGHTLDHSVPLSLEWNGSDLVEFAGGRQRRRIASPDLPLELPLNLKAGAGVVDLDLEIPLCSPSGLCLVEPLRFRVPLEVGETGPTTLVVAHTVPAGGGKS